MIAVAGTFNFNIRSWQRLLAKLHDVTVYSTEPWR